MKTLFPGLPAAGERISRIFQACLVGMAFATPLSAQSAYEDSGVFPGQEITNTIEVFERDILSTTAEASLTVGRLPITGTLRALEFDYGFEAGSPESWRFPGSSYAPSGEIEGPFIPLGDPDDTSSLTGDQRIGTSGQLGVVETAVIRQGVPVFLVLEDRALNLRSDRVDTVPVTVEDLVTGDVEVLLLTETGPDTGAFTGWIETRRQPATLSDGILSTGGFSRIDAYYTDVDGSTTALRDEVLVGPEDPSGVVFDSATGDLLDGIPVTLVDVATGLPADVLGADLSSPFPSTVVTGTEVTDDSGRVYQLGSGEFRFPYVMPGTYRISLDLPQDYDAPTVATDAELESLGGELTIATGSRLENFDVEPGPDVFFDIPVDINREGGIIRTASVDVAEIGELFEYDVRITVPATGIIDITDTLPAGIRFVPGTLVIDGVRIEPVISQSGRLLVIGGFNTRPGANIRMTYTAQVQPGTSTSVLYPSNTVIFETGSGRLRLRGDHDLRVKDAFGMEDIVILGRVVAGSCDRRDVGRDMSGIRVLLETGDYAITDEDGKFHFRDIAHRPRVVQVDTNTLPAHSRPVLCRQDTRNAGSPISRFVDVRSGMMGRAEFYVEFDADAEERSFLEASEEADFIPVNPSLSYTQEWLDRQGAVEVPRILTPSEGVLPFSDVIDAFILRPAGSKVRVVLNGEDVPIGKRDTIMFNPDKSAFMERFRNLRIEKGENLLGITVETAEGDILLQETRRVLNATEVSSSELIASGSILESDGRTTPVVTLRLKDRDGLPIRPGTIVQVSVEEPFFFMPDVRRRSESGASRRPTRNTSVMVRDDGIIKMTLAPALETWTARFKIGISDDAAIQKVRISAAERPWVLVGLAEGTIAHRTIRDNMRRSGDIGNAMSGRVSLFAEGVVKGEWLLTLRYDTAQDGEGDFQGIDPERDYVVYGDRSFQDNAAKSRFPLYLRLRKEGAEFLVGDFDTKINTNLITLNRTLTGARAIVENDSYRIMAFAAETSQRFVEDRIALDGTMGPYELSRRDVVLHSENVRLVEVSRIDNRREISTQVLESGRDYIISSGRIHLRSPMPAFSPDLNRYVLVVEYETDEDVEDGMMAGIRAEVQVSERVRAGGTVIHATRVDGQDVRVTLIGGDITFEVNEDLKLTAEAIEVRKRFAGFDTRGTETELRAEYDDGVNTAEAYVRSQRGAVGVNSEFEDVQTDTLGGEFSFRLRKHYSEDGESTDRHGFFLEGEVLAERDVKNGDRRRDTELFIVNRNAEYEYGAGVVESVRKTADVDQKEVHLASRAVWSTPDDLITWGLGMEYAVKSEGISSRDKLQFAMDVRATENLTIFSTYEGEIERSTQDNTGVLSFGAEYSFGENGVVRAGAANAFNRREGSGQSLFLGVDNGINLGEYTLFSFGADVHRDMGANDIQIASGSDNDLIDESFVTLRGGVRHTRETWSMGVDVEQRSADSGDRGNIRLSADGEIDEFWSVGGDLTIGKSTEDINDSSQFDIRLSAAHRGDDRDPITLLMLESSLDEEDNLKNRKILGSVYHSRYLSDTSHLNLRYAGRLQNFTGSSGIETSGFTNFVGAEYRHDINDQFDFGLHGSVMKGDAAMSHSYGLSLGVTPFKNTWVSAGYNFEGFDDDDFSENGYTNKGPFIQLRLKVDQDTIKDMFR